MNTYLGYISRNPKKKKKRKKRDKSTVIVVLVGIGTLLSCDLSSQVKLKFTLTEQKAKIFLLTNRMKNPESR
mgnify:CR=1 FL=1